MARKSTRPVARPATAAGPAAGAVAQTPYYDPNVTWRSPDPAAEGDQPVPASGAAGQLHDHGVEVPVAEPVDVPSPGHRDWKMGSAGMVAAERPAVGLGGEQPPRGGGQRGHAFQTSPGGPPVPASPQAAAAARAGWSTGVSNSSTAVPARPWDGARMGDEEAEPATETDHDVGGQPGLSGASVSN